jgi:hypothetical protein
MREAQGGRLDRLDHILVLSQPGAHLTGKEYEGALQPGEAKDIVAYSLEKQSRMPAR